jgi:hypothetical protein
MDEGCVAPHLLPAERRGSVQSKPDASPMLTPQFISVVESARSNTQDAERVLLLKPLQVSTTTDTNRSSTIDLPLLTSVPFEGVVLQPKYKQYFIDVLLLIITFLVVVGTIALAFQSSSSQPRSPFSSPEKTIRALNIGSIFSVFLTGELLIITCDRLRWALAASNSGLGIASFLALSRATGLIGVLNLVFADQNVGHRKWCGQR